MSFSNYEPKKKKVDELTVVLEQKETLLANTEKSLQELEDKLRILSDKLKSSEEELKEKTDAVNKMEKNLNTAKKLVNGLTDEKVRWGEEKDKLLSKKDYLVGDCLLNSSFLS